MSTRNPGPSCSPTLKSSDSCRALTDSFLPLLDEISQACESSPKSPPAKAKDVHIHCTLDPVEVKMARSTCCSSSSYHRPRSQSRSRRPRRQQPRRQQPRHQEPHRQGRSRSRPCSHQRMSKNSKRFPYSCSVFGRPRRSHKMSQLRARPSFDREDLDSYLEED